MSVDVIARSPSGLTAKSHPSEPAATETYRLTHGGAPRGWSACASTHTKVDSRPAGDEKLRNACEFSPSISPLTTTGSWAFLGIQATAAMFKDVLSTVVATV